MVSPTQHRQHARHEIDLGVHVLICDSSAEQVAPLAGRRLEARLANVSGGGAGLVLPTFLPRATLIDIEAPATGHVPAQTLRAQVMSVAMVDREPHYGLGLRFAKDQSLYVAQLAAATSTRELDEDTEQKQVAIPDGLEHAPRWLVLLQHTGLLDEQTTTKALKEAGGTDEQLAEWLVSSGCILQRDVTVAQAECSDLPYVEPGEYRVKVENHKLVREEMARAHGIFPLFALDRIMTLAVARPLDLTILDQIRLRSGCEVDQVLARPRELQLLIDWGYGGFLESATGAAPAAELAWSEILKDIADAPVVKLVDVLLDRAVGSRASDIHIDAEEETLRVRFRVDGVLREVPAPPRAMLPAIVSRLKILSHMDIAETRKPQDGHFKLASEREELDVRVSTLPSSHGEAVVMRLLRSGSRLLSLEELGMARDDLSRFDQLLHLPHGMLLVTGPTGSGKTTTLYSGLSRLDRVRQSIITLEDPVEIRLPQVRQVSVNAKAGLTFQAGLRAILRQDPDTIMLGEIRDRETAEVALQAALTGHIVLSTLHTNSAAAATTRLLDMGVPDFLVASSLVGVLAQRLCRRLCTHCARPASGEPRGAESVLIELLENTPHMEAVGCKRCSNTGYEGRVGVFELLIVSKEIRRAILDQRDDHSIAEIARAQGSQALLDDGLDKVRRGKTTVAELLRVVGHIDQSTPSAGADRPAGRQTDDPQDEFDVADYERLLAQWLRPEAVAAEVGAGGRS